MIAHFLLKVLFTSLFLIPLMVCSFVFGKIGFAESVMLAWDANAEKNLAGYKVYYYTDDQNELYSLDLHNGLSPITLDLNDMSDPYNPAFQLNGLRAGTTLFLGVTAFNVD